MHRLVVVMADQHAPCTLDGRVFQALRVALELPNIVLLVRLIPAAAVLVLVLDPDIAAHGSPHAQPIAVSPLDDRWRPNAVCPELVVPDHVVHDDIDREIQVEAASQQQLRGASGADGVGSSAGHAAGSTQHATASLKTDAKIFALLAVRVRVVVLDPFRLPPVAVAAVTESNQIPLAAVPRVDLSLCVRAPCRVKAEHAGAVQERGQMGSSEPHDFLDVDVPGHVVLHNKDGFRVGTEHGTPSLEKKQS